MSEPNQTVTADTATAPAVAPAPHSTNGTLPASPPPARSRARTHWVSMIVLIAVAVAFVVVRGPERAKADVRHVATLAYHQVVGKPKEVQIEPAPAAVQVGTWDRLVTVEKAERAAIGMRVFPVEAQTKPMQLELNGTTDYDQNTMTKIRPLFDARVTAVFHSTGQAVKKGDPLVELYSTALATAKGDLRSKFVQWDHDRKLLDSRRSLASNGTITNVIWVDTQNAEKNSRLGYLQARDKLIIYGIREAEIEKLLEHLGDDPKSLGSEAEIHDISKMVLLAPIDGVIVDRDVVAGNFYDDMAVLMVISPMDKFWVWGNVFEKDQAKVHLGQTWEVQFPYLSEKIEGKVEGISTKVDPVTRTLKIRATISNPKKEFISDMLVKGVLQIPPVAGHTVVPRSALAVIDGENCVFVQKPDNPAKFERRKIEVDQERSDQVFVRSGLKQGDLVVANGSLILSQLYEDQSILASGLPR